MKIALLSLIGLVGVVEIFAETPEGEANLRERIEQMHLEVLRNFVEAEGFGVQRASEAANVPRLHTSRLFPPQVAGWSPFPAGPGIQIYLIGLVENENGRVFASADELDERTMTRHRVPGIEILSDATVTDEEKREWMESSEEYLKWSQIDAITPPTELDQAAISHFRAQSDSAPVFQIQPDHSILVHGPIRAMEQSCMDCHDVMEGTLLGLLRYTMPPED